MKNIILTIAFLSINFVFGQIIFNNYYESNNTKGINLFENDNKYFPCECEFDFAALLKQDIKTKEE